MGRAITYKIKVFVRHNIAELLIACTGTMFALIPYLVSFRSCHDSLCGYVYSAVNGHDGMWHIGVFTRTIGSAAKTFPSMEGISLTGYNMLLDYVMHLLWRLGMSPFAVYFLITPILLAIVYVIAVFISSNALWTSKKQKIIYFLLMFYTSSFAYYTSLWRNNFSQARSFINWEFPGSLLLTPSNMYLNLPFVAGISTLLIFIARQKQSKINFRAAMIFGFMLLGFKVYAFAYAMIFCFLFMIMERHSLRRHAKVLLGLVLGGTSAYLLVIGPPASPGLPFALAPFAITMPMIESPNLVYIRDYALAKYILVSSGRFSPKLAYINILSAMLYFMYNLGTRFIVLIIGAIYTVYIMLRYRKIKSDGFTTSIVISTFALFLIPVFFVQKDHYYDTNQFGYVASIMVSIIVTIILSKLISKNILSVVISILLLAINVIPVFANARYLALEIEVVSKDKLEILDRIEDLATEGDLTVSYPNENVAYHMLSRVRMYNGMNFMAESTAKSGPELALRQRLSKATYLELIEKLPKSVKFIIFANHGVTSDDNHAKLQTFGAPTNFAQIHSNDSYSLLRRVK